MTSPAPSLTCMGLPARIVSDHPRDVALFFPDEPPPMHYRACVLEDGRCVAVPASWVQRAEETP
jgi:hypothetical protein